MARRKDHTREELTQLAIDSGRKLVQAEGPDALTARKVAQAMGYTAGTLYNIFENIEGLIVAINATTLESMAERMDPILKEDNGAEFRIQQFCLAYLDFQADEPALWNLLFATPIKSEAHSEDYHTAVHKVFDPVIDTMLPISRSLKAARQDVKIIWSTLHGICLLQQSNKLDVDEADPAEELVERFLNQFLER